jgi:hypothetical protein
LELTCGFNGIGDAGCVALAEAIANSATLTRLHLDGNKSITAVGTAAMAKALLENASLIEYSNRV